MSALLLLPVLLPLLCGAALGLSGLKEKALRRYCLCVVLCNAAIVLALLFFDVGARLTLLRWSEQLTFSFRLDGFGRVFAALVSLLWPLTTVYAFGYLGTGPEKRGFFACFLCSFGVVIGIALAGDFLTLYTFYELMTFATLPLVMHGMSEKARHAGRQYLIYSMVGAALVFTCLVLLLPCMESFAFRPGGGLSAVEAAQNLPQIHTAFLLGFLGFGVKAALVPFYRWLPGASIAPTPVTALLHAVAVVKAGVFCAGRLIYDVIGPAFLTGSSVQQLALLLAALTVVTGAVLALRTPHFKRRLAYSTVSNLSYILFAFALMTPAGLVAGTLHMLAHGVGKITLFFCAGSVLHETGREWVEELSGLARSMPATFAAFTLCALSLAGIPPFPGFQSKWLCGLAAAETGLPMAFVGVGALLVSSFCAALYLGGVILRAYGGTRAEAPPGHDPGRTMNLPTLIITAICLLMILLMPWLHDLLTGLLIR